MDLAEKGSQRPVHEYLSDLSVTIDGSQETMYAELTKSEDTAMAEAPRFIFGKTVFKELGKVILI